MGIMCGSSGWKERIDMSRREARHKAMIEEQNRIFERNALIRQKIYAVVFIMLVIAFWAYLMSYDCTCVLYGFLAIPLVIVGLFYLLTDKNEIWERLKDER